MSHIELIPVKNENHHIVGNNAGIQQLALFID